jgi:uncharacterized protein (DUF1778 family)
MMQTQEVQTYESLAQINIQLPVEARQVVERAAIVSGLSLGEFAAQTVLERAAAVLEHQHVRTLTERDHEAFIALLDSDEGPNEALRKAAEDYKRYLSQL